MALPTQSNPLTSLRCHCLSFSTYSPPTACTLPGAQNLDWDTAERLARVHSLDLEYASPATASKVLHAPAPLSTSQLSALHHPVGEGPQTGTKMVCGMNDEISQAMAQAERISARVSQQEARISGVLAMLVLGVILFTLVESFWERCAVRRGDRQHGANGQRYTNSSRSIHLRGEEKRLTAAPSQLDSSSPEKPEAQRSDNQALASSVPHEDDEFPDSPWGP